MGSKWRHTGIYPFLGIFVIISQNMLILKGCQIFRPAWGTPSWSGSINLDPHSPDRSSENGALVGFGVLLFFY